MTRLAPLRRVVSFVYMGEIWGIIYGAILTCENAIMIIWFVTFLYAVFVAKTLFEGLDRWRDFSGVVMAQSRASITKICDAQRNKELAGLEKFVSDFYEGSPVTQHILKFGDNGLIIKIGDEKNLVEVDMTEFFNSPPEALERARMAWSNLND
jgi:hypothetical protein